MRGVAELVDAIKDTGERCLIPVEKGEILKDAEHSLDNLNPVQVRILPPLTTNKEGIMSYSHTQRRKTIKRFKKQYGKGRWWYYKFREYVAELVKKRLGPPIGTLTFYFKI